MKKIFFLLTFYFLSFVDVSAQEGYQPLAPIQADGRDLVDGTNLSSYLGGLFNLGIAVAAILAVIMIIAAGFQYMTSEAFTSKAAAKNKIKYAIGGLILALGSFLILSTINSDIVSGKLEFNSVGKKSPKLSIAEINLFNKGLSSNDKWYQNEELKELAKKEDSSDFASVLNREIYPDGKTYMPENLVYRVVDALERADAGEVVDDEIINKIKELRPDIYERGQNIFDARKGLGDTFKNPINKESGSDTLFENRDKFSSLFRENDTLGIGELIGTNENLTDSNNNFIDSLGSLAGYKYLSADGRLDPAIAEIFQNISDYSNHTVDPNNPYSIKQKEVYDRLAPVIKNLPSLDFNAPLNPDDVRYSGDDITEEELRELEEIEQAKRDAANE